MLKAEQETVRVLLVENDAAAEEAIQEALQSLRCETLGVARTGQEAIRKARKLDPDIILMDIDLPNFGGITAIQRIYERRPVPVVALTAHDSPDLVVRASTAGAGAYLVKPPSPAALNQAITIARARFHDIVELHRLNAELRSELVERKRAEARLSDSERRFLELFLLSPEVLVVSTLDAGRYVEVNRAFERILGFSREEALGRSGGEIGIWPRPEERAEVIARVKREGAVHNYEALLRAKNGQTVVGLCSFVPIEFGGEDCVLSLVVDITERTRALEELRREQELVERIFQTAQVILLVLDNDGRILRFNPYFESITGYALDEVRGKDWFTTFIPGREQARVGTVFSEAVGDVQVRGNVNPILTRDGSERTIEWYAQTLKDASGRTIGLLSVGQDITARQVAEAEKALLERQLFHAQKMESIGRLAGGIAHDFNNLLMPIIGFTEMTVSDLGPEHPATEQLRQVLDAAQRARNLSSQLLVLSRKQVLDIEVIDLNEVVSSFEKMLRRIIGEDIEIVMRLDPALGTVKGDPLQIQQILMNLGVNARDAMPGGGELIIETANAVLDEEYVRTHADIRPGPYVMVSISDTGQGMTPEVASHVFEPFFTTKEPGKGTGLGLSTVYSLVRQHQGSIWLYSEPGQGTTVKVYLPRAGAAPEAPKARSLPKRAAARGTETVLVVEDDAAVRQLTCKVLSERGYRVLEAADAPSALEAADNHDGPVHLLLTDVVMPLMNGRELYERLRIARPDVKVLYMSGYTDNVIARHGVLEPGVHFIQKPFSINELAEKITCALGG